MKIFIIMHKIVDLPLLDSIYEKLLVGSYNKNITNINRDDTGDNISSRNNNYCELTGLYWIWKNVDEDIVGLCHYRRFLSKCSLIKNSKYFINEQVLKNDFYKNNIDIVLPQKNYFKWKIISEFSTAPNLEDMKIVRSVIENKYPDYLETFDDFINGKSAYLYNIIITKKNIFDEYSKWLFDILFEVEKKMEPETYIYDNYRQRMFGFISERLLNVWLNYNNKYNIKEYPIINMEKNNIQLIKEKIRQLFYKYFAKIKYHI